MEATTTKPSLYCGTYAKYNNGSIAGKWLDLDDYADAEEFLSACHKLHSDEADPELMFQDFEGFPRDLYHESMGRPELEQLYEYVNLEDHERELLEAYIEAIGPTGPVTLDMAQDALYCQLTDPDTQYMDDDKRMGWYVVDEGLLEIPDGFDQNFLDIEAIGRAWLDDMYISGDYVFTNR